VISVPVLPQWHSLFESLGLMLGARYYFFLKRRAGGSALAPGSFAVSAGCLAGAAIGNKAAYWMQLPDLFLQHWHQPLTLLLGGQSICGGLVGGLIGVELAKKATGQRQSTGDFFVFPILLGTLVGRIGCFFAGLADDTYGLPTSLPWGVDFGDGIARHPTQLYEIVFCGLLWLVLRWLQPFLRRQPGLLFKLFLSSYLVWRLCIDFLKPLPYAYPAGLSGIQWLCLASLLAYLPLLLRQYAALHQDATPQALLEPGSPSAR
jgi:prolipoprotein diacylglyceryltransferase